MIQIRRSTKRKSGDFYQELDYVFETFISRSSSLVNNTMSAECSDSSPSYLELTTDNLFAHKTFCFPKKINQILTESNFSSERGGTEPIKVHVYAGGESGNMCGPFITALSESGLQHKEIVKVEYKYKREFNSKDPIDLVNWLLDCDIHFILTHPIQAMNGWNCSELFPMLDMLRDHPGWPCGDQFDCPMFTQDKYVYLSSLPSLTNPTLKVLLPFDSRDEQTYHHAKLAIQEFASKDYQEGEGFVVKPPFETNCGPQLLKFCKRESGIDAIYKALDILSNHCHPRLPYVMIQPTMRNRKEYKVRG